MRIISKNRRKRFDNGDCCIAYGYPIGDNDINGAVIELSGKYPDKGWAINEICKEMEYVISGSGKLVVESKEYRVSEGDLVLIAPGEKFYWQGNMKLFMPCTPKWTPEQYKIIE